MADNMDKRADLRKHFANEANQAKSDAMHSERSAQLSSIEGTIVKGFNSVLNQGSGVGKVQIANDKPIKVEMEETGTDKLVEAIAGLAQLKGKDGQDGYTPKKGVDYYTEKEINDITDEIFSKVRIPNDGIDGIDGADGKTPVKGVDYYTDAEIKSIISYILGVIPAPKDGIDGKDGKTPAIDYKKIITEVVKKIPKPKDGKDGKNYGGGGYYGITELIAGAGISIDATDQYRPIITSTGGSSSGDVVGPASAVDSNLAAFDTITGKLIKDSGVATANIENTSNKVTSLSGASTDVQYPSAKLVYDQLAGKQASLGYTPVNKAGDTMTGALINTLATGNSLVVDTNTLVVDATNNRVGIGTSTPTTSLDIKTDAGFTRGLRIGPQNTTSGDGACIEFNTSSADGVGPQIGGIRNAAGGGAGDFIIRTGIDAGSQIERLRIDYLGNVGIGTSAPTHTLTLPSTSTGIALYNTADQTTNYERVLHSWVSDTYTIATSKGGTGVGRDITLITDGLTKLSLVNGGNTTGYIQMLSGKTGTLASGVGVGILPTIANTAGIGIAVAITPVINESSTAGYTALLINPTETSTGSGAKNLIDAQVGGVSKFTVDNAGVNLTILQAQIITPTTSLILPTGYISTRYRKYEITGSLNLELQGTAILAIL